MHTSRLPAFGGWFSRSKVRKKVASVIWNGLLPIIIIFSKFFTRKCLVCGNFLWYV